MEITAPSVRYTITKGDLFRLRLRALSRSRIIWGLYVVFLCSFLNTMLSAPNVQDRSLSYRIFFGLFVAGVFTIPFCLLSLFLTAVDAFLKKHQGVIGEHTITLTPEGLVESTSFNSGLQKWSGIFRVESNPRYLFIYINESMVHMVPKRAFSSMNEAQLFEQRIRQEVAQLKSTPASSR